MIGEVFWGYCELSYSGKEVKIIRDFELGRDFSNRRRRRWRWSFGWYF